MQCDECIVMNVMYGNGGKGNVMNSMYWMQCKECNVKNAM